LGLTCKMIDIRKLIFYYYQNEQENDSEYI